MILTPKNVTMIGDGLDHPEGVCLAPDGTVYAGGEAGQVYRIDTDGTQQEIGSTGGFLLGIALDGQGRIHACDCGQGKVFRIDPDGTVVERSAGTSDQACVNPNYPVFDADGNLYVSNSGDYWERERGTGFIIKIALDNTTTMFHAGPFLFANGMAIDPSGQWLYVVQSTAPNVVRLPLAQPGATPEVTHTLPDGTVPDGLAFAADGRLVIACYKPDLAYLGYPDGRVEVLCVYIVLVWHRGWRPIVLLGAVMVHGGIAIAMGMITFGLVMLIGNIAFLSPHFVRACVGVVRRESRD